MFSCTILGFKLKPRQRFLFFSVFYSGDNSGSGDSEERGKYDSSFN